jgi:hypothetical protein
LLSEITMCFLTCHKLGQSGPLSVRLYQSPTSR